MRLHILGNGGRVSAGLASRRWVIEEDARGGYVAGEAMGGACLEER